MLNIEETCTNKDVCKCLSAQELRVYFLFSYFAAIYYLKSIMKLPEPDPDQVIFPKTTGVFMGDCSEEKILRALTSDAGPCLLSTKDFICCGWKSIKFSSLPQLPICRTVKTAPLYLWRKATSVRMYSQPFSQAWEIFPSQQEHCFSIRACILVVHYSVRAATSQ